MEIAARTHIGLVRQVNQDSFAVVSDLSAYEVYIVADGMGGHSAGEVASTLATQVVADRLRSVLLSPDEDTDLCEAVAGAILDANEQVYLRADSSNGLSGMGTTIVAAVSNASQLAIGHIGDSRAYLLHGDELNRLTDDHSLVNELIKNGQLTADEANHHPQRNVLLRALGTDLQVQVETRMLPWSDGDVLVLCSDGVWGLVDHALLEKLVLSHSNMYDLVDQLIKTALDCGGADNITVIAVKNNQTGVKRGDTR
ncbi:MAG: serine/threonine protein phosphatase [Bacilli bacterium]|nr:serine/threonine protein phosphatase [Bacilli bacterium]